MVFKLFKADIEIHLGVIRHVQSGKIATKGKLPDIELQLPEENIYCEIKRESSR